MKKTLLPFIFICLNVTIITTLSAQVDFFPAGAEWYYGFKQPGLIAAEGFTHYVMSGDTVIEGKAAKIIQRTSYLFEYNNPTTPIDTGYNYPLFMTQEGDSILYYNRYDTLWQFLWKQNVVAGDEFEIPDDWYPYTMHIDSTAVEVHNSHDVKKIWLSGGTGWGQDGHAIIYDRFGPTNGFGYYSCWGFYDCYDATLCRYQSDAMGRVDFSAPVCDILSTGILRVPAIPAIVYPNPFDNTFSVEMGIQINGETRIELYTLTGALIYTKVFHAGEKVEVELTGRESGVYVGRVVGDGVNRVFKVVKD